MAFSSFLASLLIMMSLVDNSFSEGEASFQRCTSFKWPFTPLCDLGTVWGVVVPVGLGGAALASLILALVLLCRLMRNIEAKRRSEVTPLLLLLASIIGLCGLSAVYLTEEGQHACIYRYAILAMLFVPCLACLLAQGMRLHRLAQTTYSRIIGAMVGFIALLAGAQGIATTLWVVAITMNQGQLACRSRPQDLTMTFIYVLVLLSAALSGVACSWFQRQPSKCRVAWLLATWVASALLWGARLCFHTRANAALGLPSTWDDLEHALALVVQAWLLLLLHAIPEAHTWLRLASEPCPQTPANVTTTGFSEEISLSSWPFGHMQGSWSSQSSSARNTDVEQGPSIPFGSNQSITITIPEEGAVTSI
ncbi:G-protein coupled receptor family C group 5 member B-like [Brienomyrus brachyistius]|uniref:G-protein coupled receptor family C group 5 member B-like n=1 Tax=Brienomyrus brachyistius TaxID=42636 RepID=UPI0020B1D252|nr:G-protein coupled receptor family C group 5 member B-like [Brienomyrus brachyistius]